MAELPAALTRWRSQLAIFPADVARLLAPMLDQLALALGPLRSREKPGDADPEGYSGISRRGVPERLIATEWLYALELPDEFLRRAVMHEQSFLELGRRTPGSATRTVALFDAGPSQLGSPRIAHLALLIVLQDRAERAGVRFEWGVLQSPAKLYSEVSADSVRALLAGRTPVESSAEMLAQWREALNQDASAGAPAPDRLAQGRDALEQVAAVPELDGWWLIGGARLQRFSSDDHRLERVTVTDVLGTGPGTLSVEVQPASGTSRSLSLALPHPVQCTRLLRDPFAESPKSTATSTIPLGLTGLQFSPDARATRLISLAGEEAVALPIPSAAAAVWPRPKRLRPFSKEAKSSPGRIVGLGWRSPGGLMAAEALPNGLVLHGIGSRTAMKRWGDRGWFEMPPVGTVLPMFSVWTSKGREIVCIPSSDRVALLDCAGHSLELQGPPRMPPIIGAAPMHGGLHLVTRSDGIVFRWELPVDPSRQVSPRLLGEVKMADGDAKVFFGSDSRSGIQPSVAIRTHRNRWQVITANATVELCPADGTVVGVCDTGLVVLSHDRRRLELLTSSGFADLHHSPEEIRVAFVAPRAPRAAVVTARRQLRVIDISRRQVTHEVTLAEDVGP